MQTDKTYTPLKTEFDHVVKTYYPNVVSEDQIKLLQVVFFAGAAASYQILTTCPERAETVCGEILDHAEQLEASA